MSNKSNAVLDFLNEYLKRKGVLLFYVINSNKENTKIRLDDAYYDDSDEKYQSVFGQTLNEFVEVIKTKNEGRSMTTFLYDQNLWVVLVKIHENNNDVEISTYSSFDEGIEKKDDKKGHCAHVEIDTLKNVLKKDLKINSEKDEKDAILFVNFINKYRDAHKKLKEKQKPLFVYTINPCFYAKKYHEGTVAFATTTELERNDLITISSIFFSSFTDKFAEEAKNQAIRVAVAAIMSRNMSHNLGSHLITNTKNYFGRMGDEHKDPQLAADLRGIRHLLQYMQERMDYIATITSGDPYPLGSLNFKAQLFDELTIDDFSKRHNDDEKPVSNFFLKYLVYSEKYSRAVKGFEELELMVKYIDKDGKTCCFCPKNKNEKSKTIISKINFALPGGMMSRHAFFNIIENIIRNSAKHSKDLSKNLLEITIEINEKDVPENKSGYCKISIYDNKKNKTSVVPKVKEILNKITILSNGTLNKSNKGLKEMLISALWLQQNQNENIAEVLTKLDELQEDKYEEIEKYFKICDNEENFGYSFFVKLYKSVHHINSTDKLTFTDLLDICADVVTCDKEEIEITNKEGGKETVYLKERFPRFMVDNRKEEDIDTIAAIDLVEKNIIERFGEIKSCIIDVDSDGFGKEIDQVEFSNFDKNKGKGEKKHICYVDHLATNCDEDFRIKRYTEEYTEENGSDKILYVDSISGGNFTKTLVQPDFLENPLERLKVIESALTRITIIDERIFEKLHNVKDFTLNSKQYDILNSDFENWFQFNQKDFFERISEIKVEATDFLEKKLAENKKQYNSDDGRKIIREAIKRMRPCVVSLNELINHKKNIFIYDIDFSNSNYEIKINNLSNREVAKIDNNGVIQVTPENLIEKNAHYISIHLGLIEKYKEYMVNKYKMENNNAEPEKLEISAFIEKIMTQIKTTFGYDKSFISIHSGRGNFSEELGNDLKEYPFITLSSLEAVLDNSKYLLSQLFYNTVFYGKGIYSNNPSI